MDPLLAAHFKPWTATHGKHTRAVLLKSGTALGLTSEFGGARMFGAWTDFPTTVPTFKRLLPFLVHPTHDIIWIESASQEGAASGVAAIREKFGDGALVYVVEDQATVFELFSAESEER